MILLHPTTSSGCVGHDMPVTVHGPAGTLPNVRVHPFEEIRPGNAAPANRIRVAAAQMEVCGDVGRNASAIVAAIRRAAAEGADMLLTPEGSLSGYTPHFDREAVAAGAGRGHRAGA